MSLNVNGKVRFIRIEEMSKCTRATIYTSRKNGDEFITDFFNCVLVGQAHEFGIEEKEPYFITNGVMQMENGKDGKNYYKVVIFDLEESEQSYEEPKKQKTKKKQENKRKTNKKRDFEPVDDGDMPF